MSLNFQTLSEPISAEIPKIKGSKFIGFLFPVQTKEEVENELKKLKKLHHQATHHCFAYRVGIKTSKDLFGERHIQSEFTHASDDGEPSGTAAYPLKKLLETTHIENVLLVVVRYFGGTKLGVGGLVQAYTQAGQAALAEAKMITKEPTKTLVSVIPHSKVPEFYAFCQHNKITISDEIYGEKASFRSEVNVSEYEAITSQIQTLFG